MQEWVNSLKQDCFNNFNLAASDYLWTEFRKLFNSKSLKMKELSYEIAQYNLCDQLNIFKEEVLKIWVKRPLLHLDNIPWEFQHKPETREPSPEPQPLVIFKDK